MKTHPIKLMLTVISFTVACMSLSAIAQEHKAGGVSFSGGGKSGGMSGGSGWMTQGAEILPMGKKAFEFRFGFPSTDFALRVPVVPNVMEVAPFVTMDYVNYLGKWSGYFGDSLGVQLKFKLWNSGPMALSLNFDMGLAMVYTGAFNLAFQIGGPEFKFSYRWNNPNIAVIGGFKMPIKVFMIGGAVAYIPLLFTLGTEYHVLSNLNIHAHLEVGPEICAPGPVVGGHFGFQFGISYLF